MSSANAIVKKYMKPYMGAKQISESLKNGNRSSKRTDVLNDLFVENIVKPVFKESDGFKIECEKTIPCARGDGFKMDILVKKDNKIVAMFPLKAVEKSYNKNKHNYANTICGEAQRIWDLSNSADRDRTLVIHVDWVPREVPQGDRMETTSIPSPPSDKFLAAIVGINYPNSRHICKKIRFDLDEDHPEGYKNVEQDVLAEIDKEIRNWRENFVF